MGRLALVVVALASAGCDQIFGKSAPGNADAAPTSDAKPSDAAVSDGLADAPIVIDALDAPPDAPPDAPACPADYFPRMYASSTGMYRLVTTPRPWTEAAADCADDRATGPFRTHLAVFENAQEGSSISAIDVQVLPWIGLSDRRSPGGYQWVTDESVGVDPTVWAQGEPSTDPDDGQNCVWLDRAAYLDDLCTTARPYVCECDNYPNDPNNY